MNTNQNCAPARNPTDKTPIVSNETGEGLRWDDPVYWHGVRIGQCVNCKRKEKDITRFGLCWICENENRIRS